LNNLKRNNMKQTAVEWLVTHINLGLTYEQEVIFEGLFEKAKAMEKEQIDGAYSDGWMSCERWFEDKEFYQH